MIRYMKIGEICDILNGYAFKSSRYINNKGIRVIRITNVQKGYIEDAEPKFYPEKEMNEIKKFMLEDGDLLISLTGNVGRVALIDKSMLPAALNQRVGCIRVNKKDLIYKPYLYHLLNSDYFEKQCINSSNGIAQKNMSTEWLKEYHIPVYSMDYQKKIATIFDKIDIVIKKHYKQVEILDKIAKSLFIEMFGDLVKGKYEIKKLKDISKKISDGIHSKPEYTKTGRPFLSVVNINKGKVNFEDCKYVSEESFQKMIKSTHPEKGDILYTKVGATYGIAAYIDTNVEFCLYVSVCLIKPKHYLINAKFLSIQMNMPFIKYQADNRIKGIGVPDLHLNQIREFDIIVPPLDLQNRFAEYVSLIDKSKYSSFSHLSA